MARFTTVLGMILTMQLGPVAGYAQTACTEDDVRSLQAKVLEFHCWAMNDYACIKQFRAKADEKDRATLLDPKNNTLFKALMQKGECANPKSATNKYTYFKQILETHALDRAYEKFLRSSARTILTKPLAEIPRAGGTLEALSNNAFDAAAEYQRETQCSPATAEVKQNGTDKFVFQIWGAGGNCGEANYNLTDKGLQRLLHMNDDLQTEALQSNPAICKWARGFSAKYEQLLETLRKNGDKVELTYQPVCEGDFVKNFEVATADKSIPVRLERGDLKTNTLLKAVDFVGGETQCAKRNLPVRAFDFDTNKEIPIDASNNEMKQTPTPTTTAAATVTRYSKAIGDNGCCTKNGDDQAKCIRDTIHDAGGSFTNEKTTNAKTNESDAKTGPTGRR